MPSAIEHEYRRLVGKRVRMGRVWQELSQDEVAAKAGVTRNFVSAIERGVQGLDAFRLRSVADALGVRFEDLMAADERRLH
jgi:transcriptional regulator with XRE-family HTH domain